ncbi:MAG: hypothetical protein B7Z22_12235 [Hyphomonas sp. 32-62-5]|jgi:hypothetical protein|uniref:Uncharacterized protein n=1 Tax=Hyphomonas jannaschiana VP2 TaxID=1280952 RepID=A0A059FI83_9PROT|nr:hypothetical protein HJA_03806 [Hyphomonas jannaschiana VP2]OYW83654.1 MAG: hypothetical protein B7Z22_12235 [Hyphomonas sp. 32-62-5]
MKILKFLLYVFLLPGDTAIRMVGITLEEDGGIFRSLINMLFWGTILVPFTIAFARRGIGL